VWNFSFIILFYSGFFFTWYDVLFLFAVQKWTQVWTTVHDYFIKHTFSYKVEPVWSKNCRFRRGRRLRIRSEISRWDHVLHPIWWMVLYTNSSGGGVEPTKDRQASARNQSLAEMKLTLCQLTQRQSGTVSAKLLISMWYKMDIWFWVNSV